MKKKHILIFLAILLFFTASAYSQTVPKISLNVAPSNSPKDVAVALQILILMTILSLAPSILVLMTSFTRISIVLSFVRKAVGTQSTPSNQIVIALSLFLTFFVMAPVFKNINDNAFQPYLKGNLTNEQFYKKSITPLRNFMLKQTREKDLALMIKSSKLEKPNSAEDLPLQVIVPAFAISELRIAFEMGFLIYLPFLMIDMIVASILMSMGMMMLPPVLISAPFKILLFVMVDGWYIVIDALVHSFH